MHASDVRVGMRVVIGGDGKGGWKPFTGGLGTVREIKDDPTCLWPFAVLSDSGSWLNLMPSEMEPVEATEDGRYVTPPSLLRAVVDPVCGSGGFLVTNPPFALPASPAAAGVGDGGGVEERGCTS